MAKAIELEDIARFKRMRRRERKSKPATRLYAQKSLDELATQLETSEFDAFRQSQRFQLHGRLGRATLDAMEDRGRATRRCVRSGNEDRPTPTAHGDALGAHMLLHLTDGKLAEVEDASTASAASASPR